MFRTPASPHTVYAVRFSIEGETFRAERPYVWTPGRLVAPPVTNLSVMFDLHPDGERLAVALPAVAPDAPQREELDKLSWVFGFFDELRRLAPAQK
jgi:hypothetical protein